MRAGGQAELIIASGHQAIRHQALVRRTARLFKSRDCRRGSR